jgi:hypothetical protein
MYIGCYTGYLVTRSYYIPSSQITVDIARAFPLVPSHTLLTRNTQLTRNRRAYRRSGRADMYVK